MTLVISICVAVTFAVSIYLMLGRELKGIAMGVFLLGHAANLSILAMSRSPIKQQPHDQGVVQPAAVTHPPILTDHAPLQDPLATIVDPLPQALILTAIVIGFGVMAFLLTLLVVTNRSAKTINVDDLAKEAVDA